MNYEFYEIIQYHTVSIMKFQEKDTAQIRLMFRIKYYHRQGRTGIPIKNKCQECHERSLFKILYTTYANDLIAWLSQKMQGRHQQK